ncbi:cytochrome P450 (plasmid) [Sphingopyxis macrogoltabida]|nr:cytochrome P450 [Sphingopyxis macrogoltabida]
MSEGNMHKGHQVDLHFENYASEHVDNYTEHVNQIRETCPVAWTDGHWSPKDTGFWLLTRYDDVRRAAMNYRQFSRSRPSRWCNFGCGRGPSSGGFGGDV